MNVPKLRFKEFIHPLENTSFKKVIESNKYGPRFNAEDYHRNGNVKTIRGTDISLSGDIKYNQVPIARLDNNFIQEHLLKDGDLVTITTADCGLTGVFKKQAIDYIASAYAVKITLNKFGYPYYFKYYFQTRILKDEINKYIRKATVSNLPLSDIRKLCINLPSFPEQTRIADFLTAVDEKISQLRQKCDLLKQYKKGVMQQIFSQKLRFKDDDGREFPEWETTELGSFASKVNLKNHNLEINNVLTNSATQGIISQNDYFDRDIANKNNLDGYYIVEVDDFVYNPRISSNAPVGPIKRNKLDKGVMSPLYTVFRFQNGNLTFFEYFFETNFWHDYMKSISNFGARHDRMNITNQSFFALPISLPSIKEQTKIANLLTAIDDKITQAQTQLEAVKQYKKGLLQQLFV